MKPKKSRKSAKKKPVSKAKKPKSAAKKHKPGKKAASNLASPADMGMLMDLMASLNVCENCRGRRWVCENHMDQPWEVFPGCNCGAGAPCPVCNPDGRVMIQPIENMTGLAISTTAPIKSPTSMRNWQN